MTCFCPACAPMPAPTYTEEYRADCEARFVAALPSRDDRKRYIAGVRQERGRTSAAQIVRGLKAMSRGAA